MDIREMHVMFREMAQQMGMQSNRAILTEDIDICLNAVIIEKVRTVLMENVQPTLYPDKVIRQNTVISPINAIRTLYCQTDFTEDSIKIANDADEASEMNPWQIVVNSNDVNGTGNKAMLYTGFKVSYDGKMVYDCRLIENEDLGQTLRDFCNRAAPDAPISMVLGDKDNITVDLYTGSTINTWTKVSTFAKPVTVRVLYIKEPQQVSCDIANNVFSDCDLPTYLHTELVERAVSKYLVSIGATSGRTSNNNQQQ